MAAGAPMSAGSSAPSAAAATPHGRRSQDRGDRAGRVGQPRLRQDRRAARRPRARTRIRSASGSRSPIGRRRRSDGQYPDPVRSHAAAAPAAADADRGFRRPRLRRSHLAGLLREAARGQLGARRGFDRRARPARDAAGGRRSRRSPAAPTAPRRPSSTSRAKTPTATCAPAWPRSSSTSIREVALVSAPGGAERRRRGGAHALREQQVPLRGDRQPPGTSAMPNDDRSAHPISTPRTRRFYYPWIVISDPQTGAAQAGAAGRPRARRLRPHRHRARRLQGAGQRDRCAASSTSNTTSTTGVQDVLNPRGVNAIRQLPGPRHPRLGRAHARRRTRCGSTSASGGCSSSSSARSTRARSGSCSSRTTSGCGRASRTRSACSCARSGASARCSAHRGRGVLHHLRPHRR